MSIGVNIRLPHEQGANPFIAQDPKLVEMRYFFTRKLMLIKESDGYAVLPGGFGTLDELFEALTLVQTGKITKFPIVLVGSGYWSGMLTWIKESLLGEAKISPSDPDLLYVADDPAEVAEIIKSAHNNHQGASAFP
jgi:uncharacterized protein (TIGR00730 family)